MQNLRISVDEAGASQTASAVFGAAGGPIGRAENNTLVLSDAERSVSRLHARVECRAGQFLLVNMGINPVISNGAVLSTAEEAVLASGDAVRIGRFTLRVQAVDAQAEPATPPGARDDDALFDDMTGLPLPRSGAAWSSDFDTFQDSSTSVARRQAADAQWLAHLLKGLGCAVPRDGAALSAEQIGALMRGALDDTLRTWIAHYSPAAAQAWFTNFEEAFVKACDAPPLPHAGAVPPRQR